MNLSKFNGMDIAVFLETVRTGNLSLSAKTLKVDPATAFRRLRSFEERLGYALFERSDGDYILTDEGHRLFGLAETIESDVFAFDREAFAGDVSQVGTVRVTAPDSVGINYLPNLIGKFRTVHPLIQIEVSVRNQFLNMSKREADVAIRPAIKLDGNMVARCAAKMAFALYATRAYFEEHGEPKNAAELADHTICGLDEALSSTGAARWLRSLLKKTTPHYRFDNTTALVSAVKAGIGIGICPCFMGDAQRDLERVRNIEPDQSTKIWVATHPEIRNAGRVRTFLDFAFDAIHRDRNLFSGTSTSA